MKTVSARSRVLWRLLAAAGLVVAAMCVSLVIVDTSMAGSCGLRLPIVIPKLPVPGGCSGASCGPPSPSGIAILRLPSLPCPSKVIPYVPPQFDDDDDS